MENIKRFLIVSGLFAVSMVIIHRSRAPQKVDSSVQVACFPSKLAQQIDTDAALKWQAKIAYDTEEKDKTSYRCYLSFDEADAVVCTPQQAAQRQDVSKCPHFPSLKSKTKKCYFLDKKHHKLAEQLKKKTPRLSIDDLNGKIVKTVNEAKEVLRSKKR